MNRITLFLATATLAVGLLIPLADASIKGSVLLVAALAVTWALRRRSAAERHLTWVVALSLLLVLPILAAVLPGWQVLPESWSLQWQPAAVEPELFVDVEPVPITPQPVTPIGLIDEVALERPSQPPTMTNIPMPSRSPLPVSDAEPAVAVMPAVSETVAAPTVTEPASSVWDVVRISLLAVWLCGVVLFAVRLVRSLWLLRGISRRAEVITYGPLFDEFTACCRELGVDRPVQLLMGEPSAMPMAWGIWRSRILVPSVFEEWKPSQQRAVLLHELGHVLRRDPLWHGLVQFTTAFYWFHPCVWLAAWRIHVERERACDDLVLNRGVGAQDYARHLLDVVSQGRFRRIGSSVGVAMASTNKLEGRVRSILDERQDRRPLTRTLIAAGLLAALIVGPPLAMMRAEGDASLKETDTENTSDDEDLEATNEATAETSNSSTEVHAAAREDNSLQAMQIEYGETMLVVWNEAGAVGIVFESPEVDPANPDVLAITYRSRFNNGTETEVAGEEAYSLDGNTQLLELPFVSGLAVVNPTTTGATIAYDPRLVCVHPLDRTFFEEHDLGIPVPVGDDPPPPRPAVDLSHYLLPDEDVQQQIRSRPYEGQNTNPGYPRTPLTCKIRYSDNGLVIATPEGVAVFDFLGPLDRREGNEHRRGVEYRWRFVSVDGQTGETGEGEVWELSRDGQSVYSETLHYLEAGPIHIPWSINYAEAGWIYYDPAFHGVWLIRPEEALELADAETDAAELQQFAFGPRALPLSADSSNEVREDETPEAHDDATDEHTLRGFNLAPYLYTGDWPLLYEPGQPLDREMAIPLGGVWRCVINPGNWRVHYSPLRNDFYVNHTVNVSNGEGESVYYGPIAGNPIELLRLENYIVESINRHREVDAPGTPGGLSELNSLLDSNEATLVAAGFRILQNINQFEVYEEHFLRQSVDAAAEWMGTMPEYEPLVSETLIAMNRHEARIDDLKIEVPADEYGNTGKEPTDEELALNWGPEVDGLRLAVLPWEVGEPSLRLSERVEVWLLIYNVSNEPIRFSTFGAMDSVRSTLTDEESNEEQHVFFYMRDGLPVAFRYQLDPGHVMRIKHAAFWSGVDVLQDGSTRIDVAAGHTYRLSMSLQLPELFRKDGEGRILNPGRGEYFNRLEAGDVRIRVAEIDGAIPPETNESDDLEDPPVDDPADPFEEDDDATNQYSLHGFDLTPHRFTGDWDALFEPGGPLDRRVPVALGGYWGCRVNNHAWTMYYSPLGQFFYVHLRDGDQSDYFGPIDGNAIELLKIEEHLAATYNRDREYNVDSALALRYVESLLEAKEPTLMASGFRTLMQLEELSVHEEHRVRPIVERVVNEAKTGWINEPTDPPELVDQLPPREPIQVPELSDLADAALDYMNAQRDRIESLKVVIDDSEYIRGREPTDRQLRANWGPIVDGLSLALVNAVEPPNDRGLEEALLQTIEEPAGLWLQRQGLDDLAGTAFPVAMKTGHQLEADMIIRNESDEPRRFSTFNDFGGVSAKVIDETTGEEIRLAFVHFSGEPTTERYLLAPGEVVRIKRPWVNLIDGSFTDVRHDISYGAIPCLPGHAYRVEWSLGLPSGYSYNDEGQIDIPASGEFHGDLKAPAFRFLIVSDDEQVRVEDPAEPGSNAAISGSNATPQLDILHEEADGTMRFTPTNDEERELVDQILSWGRNESDGWRVGALLVNDLDSDEPIQAGEHAAVRYFLQNVGDSEQVIRVQGMRETYPTLGAGGRLNLNMMFGNENIEIRAMPGEAVSPDGFAILFDTTGLPDGEYEVYTVSAFSKPNENGNGGGSPWRVGSVPMTIGAGGEFSTESVTDEDEITWGGPVAGLQVGMRMHNRVKEQSLGSLLQGFMFVRNVSDHEITFEWDEPAPLDQNQVVYDADGEYVRLNSVFYTGIRAQNPESYTLAPGEQVQVGSSSLQSVAEPTQPGSEDAAQLVATTGEFTWTVHLQLSIPVMPQFTLVAGSGPVPIEIVSEEQPGEGDDEASNDPSQGGSQPPEDTTPNQSDQGTSEAETPMDETSLPAFDIDFPQSPADYHAEQLRLERERLAQLIEETDLVTRARQFEDHIAWGPPHAGWRAGMVIIGEDEVTAGDRVVVQFYVQNVTQAQQTIRLRKFSPGMMQTLAGHNTIQFNASGDSNEITELVAEAGEILLLTGYIAELDTTALPDGDYVIEANQGNLAYWIANPDGQAGYDHPMGRSTLRIGMGGESADSSNTQLIPADDQIWWGPDVAGMRIGMQMLDKQTDWPVGSRIESVIHVMNSTDHDITFETWWDLPSNLDMSVYTADEYVSTRPGEEMTPIELEVREVVVYDYFMRSFTIPAGEMRELGRYFLDSGAETEEFRAGLAPRLTAESGMFKWVGRLQFERADLPNFYCNMETGPAYFSIANRIAANQTVGHHHPEDIDQASAEDALTAIIDHREWMEENDTEVVDVEAAPAELTAAVQAVAAMLEGEDFAGSNQQVRACTQVLTEYHKPFVVTGRVVDLAGNPVVGATVRAICNWEPIHPTGETLTDKEGNYTLRFSELYRPTLNICWIQVAHAGMFETTFSREANVVLVNEREEGERLVDDGFAEANAMLFRGNPRRFDFTMAPGATIHGTLIDADGNRVGDTHVWIWSEQVMPGWAEEPSNFHWYLDATTNSEGEFTFTDVPTGWEFAFRGDSVDARRNQFTLGESTTPEPPGVAYSIDLECYQFGAYHATLCTDGTGTMRLTEQ